MPSGSTVLPSCASPKSAKAYRQSRYPRNRYCRSKLLFQKSNDLHTKRFTPVLWKNGMSGVKDVKEGKVVNKLLGLLPRISSPVIWKETHHESLSWRVIEKRHSIRKLSFTKFPYKTKVHRNLTSPAHNYGLLRLDYDEIFKVSLLIWQNLLESAKRLCLTLHIEHQYHLIHQRAIRISKQNTKVQTAKTDCAIA